MKNIAILLIFLLPLPALADDYLVEVKNSDKILHIDKLGLPSSATLEDVIYLLPELLGRPSYVVLNNYDIELNGFSIGSSKDIVLSNIHAYSIEKITVSESPANSYNNNGQGGTVKIQLKDPSSGFSGNADLAANTSWSVMPSAQFNYRNPKGNFSMNAFAAAEVHRSSFDYVRYHLDSEGASKYDEYTDTTRKKYDSQLLRAYMKYAPDSRNKFEFVLSADRSSDGSTNRIRDERPVTDRNVLYNVDANVKYILSTDTKGSEFSAEAKFGFHPDNKYQDIPDFRARYTYGSNWSLVGCIEYKGAFSNALTMYFGSDYNLSRGLSDFSEDRHYFGPMSPAEYSTATATNYFSPYVKAEATFGQWSLKGSVEYQFYNYNVSTTNMSDPFSNIRHDLTGSLFANWQCASNHHLRFSFERKVKRPSLFEMTPDWSFNTSSYQYIVGNETLKPMKINDIGIDYITDIKGTNSLFTLNAGVDYMLVNDIIVSTFESVQPAMGITGYYTYNNSGRAGIICGNLFLYYRSGILSISAASNIFFNHGIGENNTSRRTYYNISLQPTLTFPSDWVVLARAIWYGDTKTSSSSLGGFSTAYLNIQKTWGPITACLYAEVPFPKFSLDCSIDSEGLASYLYYRASYAYAGLKFSYKF